MPANDSASDPVGYRLHWVRRGFELGWSFVRLRGKRPIDKGWQDAPRAGLEEALAWAREGNIGVRTGMASGLVVVDEDTAKGGKLEPAPRTPTAETGGGGRHFYFKAPDASVRNSAGRIGAHIDVKGERGQVVYVGSLHPETKVMYRWGDGLSPDDIDLASLPAAILSRLVPHRQRIARASLVRLSDSSLEEAQVELDAVCLRLRQTAVGQRNNELNRAAFMLGRKFATTEYVRDLIFNMLLDSALEAGLPEREAAATIQSGLKAGRDQSEPRPQTPSSECPPELCTDLGNARRVVRRHGHDLRHASSLGWLAWDGKRWARDDSGAAMRRVKATARSIFREAREHPDPDIREMLIAWALASQSASRLHAARTLSESELEVAIRARDLDRDPFLLNCGNGTLDLRTGDLRHHRREDLITRMTTVRYDPRTKAPRWERFLDEIMAGSVELISFLQRAVGYALTGDVSEQVWFFLHGKGANGKSTFLLVILHLLGEYGMQAAPELLLAKRGEAHPTEVADLAGRRLAVCTEIEQGRALAEVQVKQLTGGDRVKARFMRQDFFEFDPTHKIFLAANHRPVIRGTDYAIWRRLHLVPFDVTFPEENQDKWLASKLLAELPGVLAWAVRGCLEWQRVGLKPPEQVRAATSSYRQDQDVFADFLAQRCEVGQALSVAADRLYQEFVHWCQANGEPILSQRKFGNLLSDRGFERRKHGGARRWWWFGIDALNPENPTDPSDPSSRLIENSHPTPQAAPAGRVDVGSTGNQGSMGSLGSPPPATAGEGDPVTPGPVPTEEFEV